SFIRMFLIEAYVIPTPSMEGALNVGDFLFVSKAHYGIRTPMTVAMFPLLHNQIPFINKESYLKNPSLDYHRLPAIEDVQRSVPFVFNWPIGDSIYMAPDRSYAASQMKNDYNSYEPSQLRGMSYEQYLKARGCNQLITRPIDKKDHYIKRAVAIAGDSIKIVDGRLFVNGVAEQIPTHRQFKYRVTLQQNTTVIDKKLDAIGIDFGDSAMKYERKVSRIFEYKNSDLLFLDDKQVIQLQEMFPDATISKVVNDPRPLGIFPHSKKFFTDWTVDNYGPLYIPKVGDQIALTPKNIATYGRLIRVYEGNTLTKKGRNFLVNGKVTKKYTVKQNYYWAMGDNRHNSEDSRAWGFVPHDHVVGKPLFIWFSTKEGSISNGINWDRIFKSATD
ncbi:MAG: signal peptidase I, partial [Saprospiraceae bacterium]